MDFMVWEKCPSDDQIICLSIVGHAATCILALFFTVVGQCIALYDSDVDGPPLHSDLHQPAVDWFPFHRALLQSFPHVGVGHCLYHPLVNSQLRLLHF